MVSDVFNMDCMEEMRGVPDKAFDLVLGDPPYGLYASKPKKKTDAVKQKNGSVLTARCNDYTKKNWDAKIPPQTFFSELRRISRHRIIFGANYFGLQGGMIVWNKINGDCDQMGCEIAYQSFNNRTDIVHFMWNGMMQGIYCGRDVGKAMVQQGNKALNEQRIHPTQKPVALYAWLLKEYAKEGWRIFDPMMGSQSSRIAAYKMGFDFVGCEIDREYFAKGCERFDAECLNRTKMPTGQIIEQLSLFGE